MLLCFSLSIVLQPSFTKLVYAFFIVHHHLLFVFLIIFVLHFTLAIFFTFVNLGDFNVIFCNSEHY